MTAVDAPPHASDLEARLQTFTVNASLSKNDRHILKQATKSAGPVKLGSLLVSIAREAGGLTDAEAAHLNGLRDKTPAEPIRFDLVVVDAGRRQRK